MTFRRGASLTTATTLGYADTADLGPSAGNGFRTRWPDDLAALQDLGITDVRITLDWARLQPKPGALDPDWAERFEQILHAADAIGLRPWACLHDGSVPRWFDNDGGIDDDETFTAWWPRWVERAADRFGDLVAGWMPFARIPGDGAEQPWIDTWGILGGGPPVIATVDLRHHGGTVARYAGRCDLLGAVLEPDWTDEDALDDPALAEAVDRWGNELRDAADAADDPPMAVGFGTAHTDPDAAGDVVEATCSMLDEALDDGVRIEIAFAEPAIAGPESPAGLLDADRAPTPASAAFVRD